MTPQRLEELLAVAVAGRMLTAAEAEAIRTLGPKVPPPEERVELPVCANPGCRKLASRSPVHDGYCDSNCKYKGRLKLARAEKRAQALAGQVCSECGAPLTLDRKRVAGACSAECRVKRDTRLKKARKLTEKLKRQAQFNPPEGYRGSEKGSGEEGRAAGEGAARAQRAGGGDDGHWAGTEESGGAAQPALAAG